MTINTDVRVQMLGVNDTNVLSDTYVDLMVGDAKESTGISTETKALRYYTCFLIASNWESIGAVESREGVKYRKPDPEKYLNLYNDLIQANVSLNNGHPYAAKESTNVGNVIADNGVMEKGNYPQ